MAVALTPTSFPSMGGLPTEWAVDRRPVQAALFGAIGIIAGKPKGLMPPLVALVVDYLQDLSVRGQVFGEREWAAHLGAVAPAPAFPDDIESTFQSLRKNHMLVYIPTKVNGLPLTLTSLGELVKKHFPRSTTGYDYIAPAVFAELGNQAVEKSCWAFMTNDVLPDSRNKSYAEQQALVVDFSRRAKATYEIPKALEAAVCIFSQYVSSKPEARVRLFSDSPWTFTRCKESVQRYQVVVGGFAPAGLNVRSDCYGNDTIGVAGLRKFF